MRGSAINRSPKDCVELIAETKPVGDVSQDVLGEQVVVIAQHPEVERRHPEIADQLEVADRLYVLSEGRIIDERACADVVGDGRALIDAYLG